MRITPFVHDRLVREVADSYSREGFAVDIQPLDDDLPDFLKGMRPDLIVTTPDRKIVVEVKSESHPGNAAPWIALKRAAKSRPGWEFELVLDKRRQAELERASAPSITTDEIRNRLTNGKQLAEAGSLDLALVAMWPALEAALRASAEKQGISGGGQSPRALLALLYRDGDLERDDYQDIQRIIELWDRAAHGYRVDDLEQSVIATIERIATTTLARTERQKRRRASRSSKAPVLV